MCRRDVQIAGICLLRVNKLFKPYKVGRVPFSFSKYEVIHLHVSKTTVKVRIPVRVHHVRIEVMGGVMFLGTSRSRGRRKETLQILFMKKEAK